MPQNEGDFWDTIRLNLKTSHPDWDESHINQEIIKMKKKIEGK
jgi:hypothetical protein